MTVLPKWEVSDIIGRFGAGLRASGHVNGWQKKVLTALEHCRTAALGGHVDACTDCGTLRISYNSCRDSNCPKCQSLERECWVMAREAELLPVVYCHAVFTLPADWNGLCLRNPRFVYDALFESAWETLQKFAADPKWLGAKGGATMVLHSWGQNLGLHPHVHAIVPGGGLTTAGQWAKTRGGGDKFLYPAKAMSKVFRAIFMKKACGALEAGLLALPPGEAQFQSPAVYRAWRNGLYQKPWVVYAKRPFGGPKQVIEYLGRYTHKTAISNHRILEVTDTRVRFAYKDYRAEGKRKEMTLAGEEFLRRFCLHIRPKGFRRMRHYGILSNAVKTRALAACRRSLRPNEPPKPKKDKKQLRQAALQRLWQGRDPKRCPCCKAGEMLRIGLVPPQARAPPAAMPHWTPVVN